MTSRYLFVYGTLKRRSRHPMAKRLAESASFVGEATIAGRLYNLGRFPGLKEPRSFGDRVHGDVYDLGDNADAVLREMDAYENAESPPPTPYERELATVRLMDDREAEVWIYWYCGDVDEADFIASGSFEDNCEPVTLIDPISKRRIGIFGLAGGMAGMFLAMFFVPAVILADCALSGRNPAAALRDTQEFVLLCFVGLPAIGIPCFVTGLIAALLPRKYQQPISLVSFGLSIFGTISIFINVFILPNRPVRPWESWAIVIAIFLAFGASYGFLLSVAVRLFARVFPITESRASYHIQRLE